MFLSVKNVRNTARVREILGNRLASHTFGASRNRYAAKKELSLTTCGYETAFHSVIQGFTERSINSPRIISVTCNLGGSDAPFKAFKSPDKHIAAPSPLLPISIGNLGILLILTHTNGWNQSVIKVPPYTSILVLQSAIYFKDLK